MTSNDTSKPIQQLHPNSSFCVRRGIKQLSKLQKVYWIAVQERIPMRAAVLLAALSVLVTTTSATMCVTYGKTDCQQHPECAVCRAFDRLDICLDVDLARKMTKGK